MKLLHVIPSFAPAWRYGGPVVGALGLTRELARQGHQVTVFTTNADGPGALDVPVGRPVPLDGVEVWYFSRDRPRWYYFSWPMARALRERVSEFDVVHIHSIYLWPTTIAAYWSRKWGVPYLIRPAGSLDPVLISRPYECWTTTLPSRVKKWAYFRTAGRLDLGGAAGFHFTSRGEMEASGPSRPRAPGYVVPMGVDPHPAAEAADLRARYPVLAGKKIVLFLSRLDPKKGLDILISALGRLASGRDDFALVVAGSGPAAYERHLAALAADNGLAGRTVFLGLVQGDDKWAVLRDADVFVLPSYRENFGFAVVEALAAGLPVVISDGVNIHREIGDAGAGIVTGLDPEEVGAAVGRLLGDDRLREDMGAAAESLASRRFTWTASAEGITRVYEEVLGLRTAEARDATP